MHTISDLAPILPTDRFWEHVEAKDLKGRSDVLFWITGLRRPPAGGFARSVLVYETLMASQPFVLVWNRMSGSIAANWLRAIVCSFL